MNNTIGIVNRGAGISIVIECEYCGNHRDYSDYLHLSYPVSVHFYTKWLTHVDKGKEYGYSGARIKEFNGRDCCFAMCICRKCSDAIATKWPVDVHMSIL